MSNIQSTQAAANVATSPISSEAHIGERLVRLPHVLDMIGLSKSMVYKMMRTGEFPQPRKIHNATVWVESEVKSWIKEIVTPNPAD